ncbi:MAG TPA: Rrf2 family transcriptional regulator [Candidatus Fraserbacteria bacterium]|nr:Rrf2 family transcriptional regulator [Candidatus Fraserbacteria bacterium]
MTMKITRKSDYGLRALYLLAMHYGGDPLSITQIASAQGIPDPFLEKIMQELREAGLIVAALGRSGGYALSRPPEEISARDLLQALEGPTALVACLDPNLSCGIEHNCPTSAFWELLNERFEELLARTSLTDLFQAAPQSTEHREPALQGER